MAKKANNGSSYTRLHRSETDKYIGGVAGGLGEYFGIDPTIIRIIFILLTVFGGSGIVIYLILWLILPSDSLGANPHDHVKNNMEEIKQKAKSFAQDIRFNNQGSNNRPLWGGLIVVLGVLVLLDNFGIYSFSNLGRLWPIILIILGFSILSKR